MIDRELRRELTEQIADWSFNASICLKMKGDEAWPVYANKAFENMFSVTQEEISTKTLQESIAEAYGDEVMKGVEELLHKIKTEKKPCIGSYHDSHSDMYLRALGFIPLEGYISLILLDMTGVEHSREKVESMQEKTAAMEDESRYQRDLLNATQNSLEETKRVYKLILENATDGFVYYNYQTKTVFASRKWYSLFQVTEEQIGDEDAVIGCIAEDCRTGYREQWRAAWKEKKETETFEYQLQENNAWIMQVTYFWYDDEGSIKEALSFCRDVTYEKLQKFELEKLAYYDTFTELCNRNYFIQWLNEQMEDAKLKPSMLEVLYIGIDRFKLTHDRLGTQIADELILKFANMLKSFESDTVKVARISNVEFAVGLKQEHANESITRISEEIEEKLKTPFLLNNGMKYYITVSMGIADFTEDIEDASDMMAGADIAMLESKKSGRNMTTRYEKNMGASVINTSVIEQKLQSAADQEDFYMLYQPQYQVETKKLRGVEALIRWHDDEFGDISPAEFIPVAEQNGTILKIGDFVIREALKTLKRWQQKYNYDGMMSINISAVQFADGKFVNTLQYYTGEYELDTSKIEIELTESVFIESMEKTVKLIKKIRDLGYRVSLDDFGTGYSSLAYLRSVPIDTLKIDRSFVTELVTEKNAAIITSSIIEMAEKLGLEVIAEGVEEQQQFDNLKEKKCGIIQGYLMGRPLAQEKVEELIQGITTP